MLIGGFVQIETYFLCQLSVYIVNTHKKNSGNLTVKILQN